MNICLEIQFLPKSFLKFLLGVRVVVFFEEVGSDFRESVEVDFARMIGVILSDQIVQFAFVKQLTHGVQDGGDFSGLDESRFAGVEHLEGFANDRHFLVIIGRL